MSDAGNFVRNTRDKLFFKQNKIMNYNEITSTKYDK